MKCPNCGGFGANQYYGIHDTEAVEPCQVCECSGEITEERYLEVYGEKEQT